MGLLIYNNGDPIMFHRVLAQAVGLIAGVMAIALNTVA
jgi:hypothetical protein